MDEYDILARETDNITSKPEDGNEWEIYKENVKPLRGGRNVKLLNDALKAQQDNSVKVSLLEKRRKLIEAIDEYSGEDPLQPWIACIKWVQESFPSGGEQSGLLPIYEQCVRTFWSDKRYHDDPRYLKIWLEYADQCDDPEVVYNFLDINDVGQDHSLFYMRYAACLELKNRLKRADETYVLGIARRAQPLDKMQNAYRQFRMRVTRACSQEEDGASASREEHGPFRSFGTVMSETLARESRQPPQSLQVARRRMKPLAERNENQIIDIYSDSTNESHSRSSQPFRNQAETNECQQHPWRTLGARVERNKENISFPTKWSGHKIPQRTVLRAGAPSLQVFVDEDCTRDNLPKNKKTVNGLGLHLRHGDLQAIKREVELLKENPLIYFPRENLPR